MRMRNASVATAGKATGRRQDYSHIMIFLPRGSGSRNHYAACFVSLAIALAIVSAPAIARSEAELAGDFDIALPLTNISTRGLGISARLGYEQTLGPVVLTPEASMGLFPLFDIQPADDFT